MFLRMSSNLICLVGVWLTATALMSLSTPPAEASSLQAVVCPGASLLNQDVIPGVIHCDYKQASGFSPVHDGGPWLNVDLLHASLADLQAIHDGKSGMKLYAGGPLLPPLDLVHAQICLSDPEAVYNLCPNNYPFNQASHFYGYTLNPKFIPLLSQGLENVRRAGLKVVLRFTYNYPCTSSQNSTPTKGCVPGPNGNDNDAPMDIIISHMRLLAPVIQANSDIIYALQAGFLGQWGEWHNSTSGNDSKWKHNQFLDVFTHLFSPFVQLEVRRPYVALDYALHRFGNQEEASLLLTRLGMHDDEFGSNLNDGGTFASEPSTDPGAVTYSTCDLRKVSVLLGHAYTMTGETSTSYNFDKSIPCGSDVPAPESFLAFASDYTLSTLQLVFSKAAWTNWVATGVYDLILDKIGPHLSLVSMSIILVSETESKFELTLRNNGWAAIPSDRPAWLIISKNNRIDLLRHLPITFSALMPGQTTKITTLIPLSAKLLPGNYVASLYIPDASPRLLFDPRYGLIFENIGVPSAKVGFNLLASFCMK